MTDHTTAIDDMRSHSNPDTAGACPRCRLAVKAEMAYCEHCGYALGASKPVPRWHLHRRLYNWTLGWAYRPSAAWALFGLSFAESSFFPVPPDVLLMPLALGNRRKWAFYAGICTLASVLGGMAGYAIGFGLWHVVEPHIFNWFGWAGLTREGFDIVAQKYQENNFLAVFTAGFTPIPFKLFTIAGGVCKINFTIFVLASIVSRGGRFFLVAGLMRLFGAKVTPFIEKYFNWLALLFTALLIGGFAAVKYL